tara:strand:+ start:208 stop:726 length:519 start_codon:yes stop_codon:yes gene_type:complete
MYTLGTTRFNTTSWNENMRYREKKQHQGCIYGTPKQITETLTLYQPIFVLEMQNDENKIMGIGLIRNAIVLDKHHNIYSDHFYNRYAYKGKFRIDRKDLNHEELKVIVLLDALIFKGYHHLKRGQGITVVPSWITSSKHINFIKHIRAMFRERFGESQDMEKEDINVNLQSM